MSKYTLGDAEQRHTNHPTFIIPSLEERQGLVVGCYAKLLFILPEALRQRLRFKDDGEKPTWAAERMWVRIYAVRGPGRYSGILENEPTLVEDLHLGDKIYFEARHICAVDEPDVN